MNNNFLDYVQNYPLKETKFYNFTLYANQNEFLMAQRSFFYAVQAFPRMLCQLGSKIEDSKTRLLVVDNIWEEHGLGNESDFHTESFLTYLKSLGLTQKDNIKRNIFVDKWIENVMSLKMDSAQYAAYLAGIEFIYARISSIICDKLNSFELKCHQSHYSKHSVLDFQHGQELLDVAFACSNQIADEEIYSGFCSTMAIHSSFCQGISDFVNLFNDMSFITQKEVLEIANEKIAFYYSREDSSIEIQYTKPNDKILIICSGGEHIIKIKERYPYTDITALDINPFQLELSRNKIKDLLNNKDTVFSIGKFEKLFACLAKSLTHQDLISISREESDGLFKLNTLCKEIFSNEVLNTVFTKAATQYSYPHNFSEHFYKVFSEQIKNFIQHQSSSSNIGSVLGKTNTIDYPQKIDQDNINYFCGSFEEYFIKYPEENFDLISVSNIGDWMSQENYKELLSISARHVKNKGSLIARKLLGNYDLKSLIGNYFPHVHIEKDNTSFYTQCIVGQK